MKKNIEIYIDKIKLIDSEKPKNAYRIQVLIFFCKQYSFILNENRIKQSIVNYIAQL